MVEINEINSTFYALRLLSHRLDAAEINVVDGEEYPASEFTKEEQEQALVIIRSIEETESVSSDELSSDQTRFYLTALADRIEELAYRDLANAGYAMDSPSPDLQIGNDRLRGEVEYRTSLAQSLQIFFERISSSDPDMTCNNILTQARELVQAERGSLWVFDEGSSEIILRAAAGFAGAQSEVGRLRIGEGLSGKVLESGQPLIVENSVIAGLTPEPGGRKYKTTSFISYPITLGGRKIGVLNLSDKSGGRSFDTIDLSLLEIIGPQIAIAMEVVQRQERATLSNDT